MARDMPVPPASPSPDEHPDGAGQRADGPAGASEPAAAAGAAPGAAVSAPLATAVEAQRPVST